MKFQSATHRHRRIHVAILPAGNSLANHFLESRERLFAGSEFRVRARGRVSVCLRVLSQFLRVATETCEIRSNVYSREMSFHVMSDAINVIDPLNVRSSLKRQHVSRFHHIYVHTSVRFQ
jgi:hypothetical protein